MAVGGANRPNSPRQKMINLMYLVFIAMLALNVSSEVLNGFELVEESLENSIENSSKRNEIIAGELSSYYSINPEKVQSWHTQALKVKQMSDSLYNYIQKLKVQIVKEADGRDGNVHDISKKDDLNAASTVMLNPINKEGRKLKKAIDDYRIVLAGMIEGTQKIELIESSLNTTPSKKTVFDGKSWEEAMFENMPVSASVTILTKLQSDIRNAEGEVLSYLLSSIDVGDFRVNRIQAQVIPESPTVISGSQFKANIVLSAVDSTQQPKIYVNGAFLDKDANGMFVTPAGSPGTYPIKGYIETTRGDGSISKHEFSSEYYVTQPTATVSSSLMNVLYAGINNPLSIAVPGVPSGNVTATMTNGTLTRSGGQWVARPSKVGEEAVITISAKMTDGHSMPSQQYKFRVRSLPDPMPFIEYQDESGQLKKFRGGTIAKRYLLATNGIKAAIDDDLLNVTYTVLSFELTFFDSMGNAIPEVSNGTNFSDRQKNYIRRLNSGKRFFISRVIARGPDGIDRQISPIEVIVR